MAAKKKSTPSQSRVSTAPKKEAAVAAVPEWRPVFADDKEMWDFLNSFSEAVSGDIRAMARARREGEEMLMRGFGRS